MRRLLAPASLLLLPVLSGGLAAQAPVRRAAAAPPSAAEAIARAERLLLDPSAPAGTLPVACRIALGADAGGGAYAVAFEVTLALDVDSSGAPPAGPLRVTLLAATLEGDLASAQRTVEVAEGLGPPNGEAGAGSAAGAEPGLWVFRDVLEAGDELHGAVAVVEDLASGEWGGAVAELADDLGGPPPSRADSAAGSSTPAPGSAAPPAGSAPARSPRAAPAPPAPSPAARVIAILPPRERPATGRTRFQTLITTDAIDRVEFFLDGEPAGADETPPYSVTLDLGAEARPHTVRAVAYERTGGVLGEHTLEINQASARAFSVAIRKLEATPAGSWELEAEVVLPAGAVLDRVEVYRNQELLARLAEPPFRASVPGGEAGPSDYARVVAYLADGTAAEDVAFLAAGIAGERVEVNLVELFAVVTGKDGEPVEGLTAEDFEILVEGRPRPLERFQHADDVPLTLGLAVDTSESMWPLMLDTRQAASRFLVNTLIPGDRALLVAFSNRPRLIAGPTGEVQALLQSFGRLTAGGATALYDSIVFSLVQLQEAGEGADGRRAVVLLTDGQDYGSRFRPRRVIDDARAQGTPVYVISLAGLYNERGSVRKPDLEAIVNHTGGRIFYIENVAELTGAYAQINRELRTQYALAFATDRPLSESQLRSIRVRMKRPGLEVRAAVEPGR